MIPYPRVSIEEEEEEKNLSRVFYPSSTANERVTRKMEFTGRMEIEETLASPGRGRDVGETGEEGGGGKEKGGDGT